ncbi:MAG: hypothetical protein QM697_06535 [Lachnospiraceae bacterium]
MKEGFLQLLNLSTINEYKEGVRNINMLVRRGECCLLWGKDYTGRIFSNIFKGEGQIIEGCILIKNEELSECRRALLESRKLFYVDGSEDFMGSLDLAENLFLLKKNSLWKIFFNEKAVHIQADSLLAGYGLESFNAKSRMKDLSAADRILLSIVRLAGQGARMLVLNNVSPQCSEQDMILLKKLLKKLREEGIALLIYDNHPELFEDLADHIFFIKQGEILKKIIDREDIPYYPEFGKRRRYKQEMDHKAESIPFMKMGIERRVEFAGIRLSSRRDLQSITVKEGEIVRIADLDAFEQAELWESLLGKAVCKPTVRIDGRVIEYRDVHTLVKNRITFWGDYADCAEIFNNLSIKDNILLPSLKRISCCGGYRAGADYIFKDNFIMEEAFKARVSCRSDHKKMSENDILKTILYKWKLFHPRVIILNSILSRTDADMKEWLKEQLAEMADRGTAVILLEPAERDVRELAHRVLEMGQ